MDQTPVSARHGDHWDFGRTKRVTSSLTVRAIVARTAGDDHPLDRCAARFAGAVRPPIDLETVDVFAGSTVGQQIGQVIETGASVAEAGAKHRTHRGAQALDLGPGEISSRPVGPDA